MSDFEIDTQRVRANFSHAADSYEQHDGLQRKVQQWLLERLDFYSEPPQRIIDVGAGTGRGSALLKKRYAKAQVIAIDIAIPMLRLAKAHASWRRPFARIGGQATALPLPDHSVDIVHSNLCFQWVGEPAVLFAECARVLKPGGMLLFSTFGPDTLRELRAAWAAVDRHSHVSRFLDMHDLGDAMMGASLRDPVLDVERFVLTYPEPQALLGELKGLGATCAVRGRERGLTGKHHFRAMLAAYEAMRSNGRIPATWEVVMAHAWGPAPGQSRIAKGGGEIASFPLDSLRGSHRR